MIHINAVRHIIDPEDKTKERPVFTFKFIKKSTGAIASGKGVCTSTHNESDSIRVKFIPSNEVRSFHALQLIEFNGEEVIV